MYVLYIVFFYQLCIMNGESARILGVFPTPSISHQVVFRPLMQELAKLGHEVTVITPDPVFTKENSLKNLVEIDVHNLSYSFKYNVTKLASGIKTDLVNQVINLYKLLPILVEKQFKTREVQSIINNKNKTFDLLFTELFTHTALGYSHFYKVPIIQFSSVGGVRRVFDDIGAAFYPNIYPIASRQRIYDVSFWENVYELYKFCLLYKAKEDLDNVENAALKDTFDPKILSIEEIKAKVSMIFLNVHPLWDFNRPVPSNVIYLYGIHQPPRKELPKDLQLFLDKSNKSVIYMSLGTNSQPSLLPPDKINIFLSVFSTLSYNILLKWDSDELPGSPENVKVAKSFPQSDLLRHPKIKAFVTQAGFQSSDEAITAGVPLVAIPLLTDQWFNAEMYEYYNIGIKLDIETLTIEKFKDAINTVINDSRYKENIIKLNQTMHDQAHSSLQRAVLWTEYILRHEGLHLRTRAAGLSLKDYYELEIVAIVFIVLLTFLIFIIFVYRLLLNKLYKTFFNKNKIKI